MAGLGGLLLILGLGSLLLPMFDLQFRILEPIEPYQPIAGIVIAAIGAVLLLMPRMRSRTVVVDSSSAPPADRTTTTSTTTTSTSSDGDDRPA